MIDEALVTIQGALDAGDNVSINTWPGVDEDGFIVRSCVFINCARVIVREVPSSPAPMWQRVWRAIVNERREVNGGESR